MKTYLVTFAQNATPVHRGFLEACEQFCDSRKAKLHVIPGRYRNPTSRWSKEQDTDEWWADEVVQYVSRDRTNLGSNLRIYSDISIQPTASRPLTGFEVFLGHTSGIFGHPKRALEVVPSGTRTPRVMWTTGACTIANYTDSKAGRKGQAHHVIGALVVEVDDDGTYFCRHVSANGRGEFIDLDVKYTRHGPVAAPRALGVTLGDYHSGQEDEAVLEATEALVRLLRPKHLVLHDVLDFGARSHHRRNRLERYESRFDSVDSDVRAAVGSLRRVRSWGDFELDIVRSNHDEFFERWLEDTKPGEDPVNDPYYHAMWAWRYEWRKKNGAWPNLFEMEAKRLGFTGARFLKRDESLMIGDVEHAFHGDRGVSGSRGTTQSYVKVGVKVTKGHDHTPCIRDGVYSAGVTGRLDQGYNSLPGTWLNAHVIQYADGKRTIAIIIDGRYQGGKTCSRRKTRSSTCAKAA